MNITITGTLSIPHDELEPLLRRLTIPTTPVPTLVDTPASKAVSDDGKCKRMAYTMEETAEILGISYITVHRLIQRGC